MSEPAGQNAACPTSEEIALLRQWDGLQSAFRRLSGQLLTDVEAKAGVAPSSFQVLWFLMSAQDNTARMNQLARTLDFSTAGTTKVADRLAEAGLIARSPSAEDRRVILVTLTEQGVRVGTEAALALAGALRERAVGPLGVERFAGVAEALASLGPDAPGQCPASSC